MQRIGRQIHVPQNVFLAVQIFAVDWGVPHFNGLARGDPLPISP